MHGKKQKTKNSQAIIKPQGHRVKPLELIHQQNVLKIASTWRVNKTEIWTIKPPPLRVCLFKNSLISNTPQRHQGG